ncbi:hypothetical protein GALMADRAFT_234398 [Galerina marginata CBS 339.88]|uniref:Uncharacterized protein n=1 Tax=Galerina marginata (strain CBS 339.88) TaxID=685588 RepID=A0A067TQR2_GALM3|nr:hypothetical protein GALMADRAFT_234398 [Galerina marginata CBS 339.88]
MPFKVVNPERGPSRSSSSSSYDPVAVPLPSADRISLRSFVSSSEHTAFSDRKISLDDEKPPRYIDDRKSVFLQEKTLPAVPREKATPGPSDDYDPYAVQQTDSSNHASSSSMHTSAHPLTTASQLASALGPDNAPYSTEIDTIPCAGVRIPHGPLTGLLAWRLVVRTPTPTNSKRAWWSDKSTHGGKKRRRRYSSNAIPPPLPVHTFSYSDNPMAEIALASVSTGSLPLPHLMALSPTPEPVRSQPSRPHSAMLSRHSHVHSSSRSDTLPRNKASTINNADASAIAANFILDTSLPYSIISRDTLKALGYPSNRLPSPATSDPHSPHWEDDMDSCFSVTLSIQHISTRLRIARPDEASRLGVQFLHDAGVSVFFPKDGEGVGPVLYLESARLLKDVPRTITSLPAGARGGTPKTLQQRVRALFGLA